MKETFPSLFKNYGVYLWPVLVLVVVVLILFNIDLPKINEIYRVYQELTGIKERLEKLTSKSNQLANLQEAKLKGDLTLISQNLPDSKDAPSILRTVDYAASSSGVFVESLDLTPGKIATLAAAQEKQNELFVRAAISGTDSQIKSFLEKIFTAGRIMDLRKLELSYPENASGSGKVNLDLRAFFLTPSVNNLKPDDPLPVWGSQEDKIMTQISQREALPPSLVVSPSGKTDLFK